MEVHIGEGDHSQKWLEGILQDFEADDEGGDAEIWRLSIHD